MPAMLLGRKIGMTRYFTEGRNVPVIEFAITSGADPKINYDGYTALHAAAEAGHLRLAQMMLDKGMNVNAHDSDGNSPLTYALKAGHKDMIALLRKYGATDR